MSEDTTDFLWRQRQRDFADDARRFRHERNALAAALSEIKRILARAWNEYPDPNRHKTDGHSNTVVCHEIARKDLAAYREKER